MYDTILVPTDGSDHAVRAAEHALYLARAFDAAVHVINVVDVQGAAGPFDAGGVDESFTDRLESAGREAIGKIERVAGGDDRLHTAVVEGGPAEAILAYADDAGVDLIAMGTHGRTGIQRYVAGSVTERVVRLAEVPVLTARATDRSRLDGDYGDVLVPTDGSEGAAVAVEHALAIAEAADARVHAVGVVDVGALSTSPDYTLPADVIDRLEAMAGEATGAIADRAREVGLDAVSEVRQGYPASTLLDYADDAGVDLIAMGTRGRTGLSRYLLGSTTERIVRHAEMPVLAVDARGIEE